jgi:hypothetical protein
MSRHPVAEPEVHLLPAGYIGRVTIEHGRADGAPAEREGDARLYRIPEGGVLATAAPPNYGVRPPENMHVYQVGADGTRTRIPSEDDGSGGPCVLAIYQLGRGVFHYVVDVPANASKYPNPAVTPGPR